MALILEDGTGRADAQSFVSIATIADWASARGLTFSGSDTVKEQNAQKAFDYLRNARRFRKWRGTLLSALQRGPYPRTGVVLPDGSVLPDGVIPWQLTDAQCALAVMSSGGVALQGSIANGGAALVSKTIGPISKTFAQPQPGGGPFSLAAETIFTEVIGYLAPLLSLEVDSATVTVEVPEVPDEYVSSNYSNNS